MTDFGHLAYNRLNLMFSFVRLYMKNLFLARVAYAWKIVNRYIYRYENRKPA